VGSTGMVRSAVLRSLAELVCAQQAELASLPRQ